MQPTIRRAAPSEAEAVADVYLRSRAAAYPAIPRSVHDDDDVRDHFRTVVLADPGTRETWVALEGEGDDEQIVGMLVLDGDWLDHLYVLAERTGKGLGSRLLDLAKSERPQGLDLWAFQSNVGARRFYERHRFVAVATTVGDNEEGEPDVRYHWEPGVGPGG